MNPELFKWCESPLRHRSLSFRETTDALFKNRWIVAPDVLGRGRPVADGQLFDENADRIHTRCLFQLKPLQNGYQERCNPTIF